MITTLKTCFKCGAEKPLSEFYKHSGMTDGHLNKCKGCTKKDSKKVRESRREYYMNYDRNRPNHEERTRKNCERTKRQRRGSPEVRKKLLEKNRESKIKFPMRMKARYYLSNAVRDGKIVKSRSCGHCGVSGVVIHGHHWSYEEPHWLDVVWLCVKCHGKEHKRLNALNRDPDKHFNLEN